MRIAMMTNNYKPVVGGVPVSVERLSAALRERGHEVTIFAPHHPEEQEEFGVVRFRSRKHFLENGMVIPAIFDQTIEACFQLTQFDVIHVHHPMIIGYMALYLANKYDIPLAFTYHTRYEQYLHYIKLYDQLQKKGESMKVGCKAMRKAITVHNRLFTNACDLVFAPTPLMRSYLHEHGTIRPVVVMPTGLGDEDFVCREGVSAELRSQYSEGRSYLFCCVARLEKEKSLSFLLRSLAIYKQQKGDCFRFLLIGEGTERQALEQEAEALGMTDNVIFTGAVPRSALSDYYRACDLFLFSSTSETQGIVLLEGMAAGLPVVAVEASGVCDVVVNGVNGWMTPADASIFADRIDGVLSDADTFVNMGRAAVETAYGCTAFHMAATAEESYEWMCDQRIREKHGKPSAFRRTANENALPGGNPRFSFSTKKAF